MYYLGDKLSTIKGETAVKILVTERIKELMKEYGLNQVKLAARIGVKQNTVSSWVNGIKEPSIRSLWLLADFFEVSVDYLIGRTENDLTY